MEQSTDAPESTANQNRLFYLVLSAWLILVVVPVALVAAFSYWNDIGVKRTQARISLETIDKIKSSEVSYVMIYDGETIPLLAQDPECVTRIKSVVLFRGRFS